MTELTPEEREILEKLKRDDAARDAIPESEKVPVAQPDKYAAPIGLDDEGNPLPDPAAQAKRDLAATLETATRRMREGFQVAAERFRELGAQLEQRGADTGTGGGEPTGAAPGAANAGGPAAADDALSQLRAALAAKAPDAGPMAPFAGAARQLEQTLTQLGRVIAAATSDPGRQAIAAEVQHVRDTIHAGEGAAPTDAQRASVHEGLSRLWKTLTELGEDAAAAPADEARTTQAGTGDHMAAPDAPTADRAASDAAELAGLLNALETGALPAEEVERRLAALRRRPEGHGDDSSAD